MEKNYRGILVSNAFLKTAKFTAHTDDFLRAAKKYDITLTHVENAQIFYPFGDFFSGKKGENSHLTTVENILSDCDFVLFWDKDVPLGTALQECCDKKGIRMFNRIEAIAACDDKAKTYEKFVAWNNGHDTENGIPILPTVIAPMTYKNIGYTSVDFVKDIVGVLGLPLVIKECFGSFGQQVYLAESLSQAQKITGRLAGKKFIYQKYHRESKGRDVRLQVVGKKVVAAMYRCSETDFRANISNGGKPEPYAPSARECELALRVTQALGLDFGGVDLLFTESNRAEVVCEVNSNAHFKNIYDCTRVNTADCIMAYILSQLQKDGK